MKLGTRLFLLFLLAGIIPVALTVAVGWMQFRQTLRLWTVPSFEEALDASLGANRLTLNRLQIDLETVGRRWVDAHDQTAEHVDLAPLMESAHVDLVIYARASESGWELVGAAGVDSPITPPPTRAIPAPVASEFGPQRARLLRLQDARGDLVAAPTYVWRTEGGEGARLQGCLLVGTALGPGFFDQIGTASEGLEFYVRFLELGGVLRSAYLVLLGLALLIAFGVSLVLARRVARSISRPVEDLVQAMEVVGRGGDVSLEVRSRIPEMTTLASAFAQMRATLRNYEAQLREVEQVRATRETARFVAHEIRNTLTPVNAGVAVLEKRVGSLPEESRVAGRRALDVIKREADRMGSLARSFSDYAHLPEPNPDWVSLEPILKSLESEVPESVDLRVESSGPLPAVFVDGEEIERLFRNLVKNASEAMDGQGRIRVAATHRTESRDIEIVVADDGPGMDARTLSQAFQPGFTTKSTGTGLGLALVRRSLSHYGGSLRLESEPGQGTRAYVTIPVRERGLDAKAAVPPADSAGASGSQPEDSKTPRKSTEPREPVRPRTSKETA